MKLLEHSETVDPAHASSGGCALHLFPALLCASPSRLHKMAETSGVDRRTITTRRILSLRSQHHIIPYQEPYLPSNQEIQISKYFLRTLMNVSFYRAWRLPTSCRVIKIAGRQGGRDDLGSICGPSTSRHPGTAG